MWNRLKALRFVFSTFLGTQWNARTLKIISNAPKAVPIKDAENTQTKLPVNELFLIILRKLIIDVGFQLAHNPVSSYA